MDEIDAALDFRNVSIVANYIKVSNSCTVVKPFTPSSGQIKITQKTKYLFVNPKVRIDFQKVPPKRFHLNGKLQKQRAKSSFDDLIKV